VKGVAWEPPALDEFDDALAVSRDPTAFQRAVDDALNAIATGRITYATVGRSVARECPLTTPPYSIIYTETDDEIRVWVFAHQKRRRGYWKNRLLKP
jgi:hypothetical protein